MKKLNPKLVLLICTVIALVSGLIAGSYIWKPDVAAEAPTTKPIVINTTTSAPGEATTLVAPTTTEPTTDPSDVTIIDLLPLSISGGSWDASHCQGMTVDLEKGYAYFSFTYAFVKTDLEGHVLGTLTNITAHLGDIAYNEADGRVYGAYIAAGMRGLYVAIIDVDNLNEIGVNAEKCDLFKTVFVKAAWTDYTADVDGNGKFDGNVSKTLDHRFGCGGVDGLTFAPSFVKGSKLRNMLTVGYGMYLNTARDDNDYQVILQYDVSDWWDKYARPIDYGNYHKVGPDQYYAKYFIYTGNIKFGIQTMTYDSYTNNLFFTVYGTRKSGFPAYNLYVVNGSVPAKLKTLEGNEGLGEQRVLTLRSAGSHDENTGIYGYNVSYGNMGLQSIGNGYFYVCHAGLTAFDADMALAYLYKWTGNPGSPFSLAID